MESILEPPSTPHHPQNRRVSFDYVPSAVDYQETVQPGSFPNPQSPVILTFPHKPSIIEKVASIPSFHN